MLARIATIVLCFFCTTTVFATEQEIFDTGAWTNSPWTITSERGRTVYAENAFVSDRALTNVTVRISANLQERIRVASAPGAVKAGEKVTIALEVKGRDDLLPSELEGSIALYARLDGHSGSPVRAPAETPSLADPDPPTKEMAQAGLIHISSIPLSVVAAASGTAIVTVRTHYELTKTRAGSGLPVYVDDKPAAYTKANGIAALKLSAGKHRISAFRPSLAGGATTVAVIAGKNSTVDLILTGEGLSDVVSHSFVLKTGAILPASSTFIVGIFQSSRGNSWSPRRSRPPRYEMRTVTSQISPRR